MRRSIPALLLALCLAGLSLACSGGGGGSAPTPAPSSGTLVLTIYGLPNPVPAAISIQGPAGFTANPTAGATYTVAPGAYTITALPSGGLNPAPTSQVASVSAGQTRTAVVTYSAPAGFAVTPASLRIAPGTTQQFTAWLDGSATSAVTWSLQNFTTPSPGASINAAGLLTAGSTLTSFEVKAVNNAAPTQSAVALATVAAEVSVQIVGPASSTISSRDAVGFSASVSPQGINPYVTWSVQEGSAGGRVIDVAWYNAFLPPTTVGVYHPVATSIADPSKQASIAVTVQAPPSGAGFAATAGAPAATRAFHAAATLGDGRIVLMGGSPDQTGDAVASAELFNPATGAFSTTGTPALGRPRAASAALDATRLLLCGGVSGWNEAADSGEIYDGGSGSFVASLNSMSVKRTEHAVLRLAAGPNAGRLLVLGGNNGPIPYGTPSAQTTALVDLFDPATLRFTPHPQPLQAARAAFTATELPNGKILIAGGFSYLASGSLATAELYDPASGTFSYTASPMTQSRAWHTATLLTTGPHAGKVLLAGGNANSDALASAELYDPASGSFSALAATMLRPRQRHTATRLADGRVLIAGGEAPNRFWGSVEVFDPATGSFSYLGGLAQPRSGHTATVIGAGPWAGKVLLYGGQLHRSLGTAAEIIP